MPDIWEVDNSLNPLADDASGDPDGDGVSNLGEYNAATDPHIAPQEYSKVTPKPFGALLDLTLLLPKSAHDTIYHFLVAEVVFEWSGFA